MDLGGAGALAVGADGFGLLFLVADVDVDGLAEELAASALPLAEAVGFEVVAGVTAAVLATVTPGT